MRCAERLHCILQLNYQFQTICTTVMNTSRYACHFSRVALLPSVRSSAIAARCASHASMAIAKRDPAYPPLPIGVLLNDAVKRAQAQVKRSVHYDEPEDVPAVRDRHRAASNTTTWSDVHWPMNIRTRQQGAHLTSLFRKNNNREKAKQIVLLIQKASTGRN